MGHHKSEMLEIAIFVGIVTLLISAIALVVGHDISANAVNGSYISPKGSISLYWTLFILMTIGSLLFVLIAFNTLLSSWGDHIKERELKDFVHQCRQRGYSKEFIAVILKGHGWHREEIDKYV